MNRSLKNSQVSFGSGVSLVLAGCVLWFASAPLQAASVWTEVYEGGLYGNDYASAAVVDKRGDVIVTGQSDTSGHGTGISTVMYDPSGKRVWANAETVPGAPGFYEPKTTARIALDSSGSVTVLGQVSYAAHNAVVATYTVAGKRTNRVEIAFPGANDWFGVNGLQLYPNGDFSVVGYHIPAKYGSGQADELWFVARYDSTGKRLWYDDYSGMPQGADPVTNYAIGGAVDSNGNLFVGGTQTYDVGVSSMVLMAYDPSGKKIVNEDFEESDVSTTDASAFLMDSEGSFYVVGAADLAGGNQGIQVEKYHAGGAYGYDQDYFVTGHNIAPTAISADKHGNLIVAGGDMYDSSNGIVYNACRVVKFSPTGRRIWSHTSNTSASYVSDVRSLFTSSGTDEFYCVLGLVNITGTGNNGNPQTKIATEKFSADGLVEATQTYIGSPTSPYRANATTGAYDPASDSVFAVGYQLDAPDSTRDPDYNWVTLKYQFGK